MKPEDMMCYGTEIMAFSVVEIRGTWFPESILGPRPCDRDQMIHEDDRVGGDKASGWKPNVVEELALER